GNIISFIVLHKKEPATTNILLQGLAITDTLYLWSALFSRLLPSIYRYTNDLNDEFWLEIRPYSVPIASTALTASNWMVVVVTIDRYIYICHPLKAERWCTFHRARLAPIFVWLFAIIYTFPRFFELTIAWKKDFCRDVMILMLGRDWLGKQPLYNIIYKISINFVLRLAIPVITIITLNAKLIIEIHRSNRTCPDCISSISSTCESGNCARNIRLEMKRKKSHENSITRVLIAICVIFMLCLVPVFISTIINFIKLTHIKTDKFIQAHNYIVVTANTLS
ncbi:unnamed protein product, partial [Owenia fusiformis]